MERGKRVGKSSKNTSKTNNNIYMDLKEIIREYALCYLPAKALHRSVTVCRDWKLQISSPFFIHNQSISFRSVSGLFLQSPGSPPSFLSLDQMAYGVPDPELKFLPEPVDVRASCNGLLCCQGRAGDRAYYVCNPVNKQWKKLPKPTASHGSTPAIVLVFEPSLLNFVAEYKVVCLFPSTDIEEAYEFEIYSSAQDSWKVPGEMFFSKTSLCFDRGLCVNGVAYWPTNYYGKVTSFDLKKERAVDIYGCYNTYTCGGAGSGSSLGEIDGKLCLASMRGLAIAVSVLQTIYAHTMPMNSKTRPWETKHQVQLKAADVKIEGSAQPRVLLTWDNVIVFQFGKRVFSHNLKTSETTTLSENADISSGCAVFPYVNSLVCLI
uniref:F-box associated beta-propeller type 1 domain-containing protein n=1 Tax=Opuntia streptacantha TaxID=393608 RepID=A0A7C9F6S5_OPUST